MAIDKQVSVDFDVNGQQYAASMQQMVASTQAYSASADTMLGKITKISGFITNTMMKASNGLTKANKTATVQAAAYQQKLSGLEATAKLVGEKTFPKLEKQTMKLAREFPIGIGQAVEQMESLQKSGIKAGDTMGKLAINYTKLGAATGTYAPAIGEAMTEFTRSMGNNLSMTEGFGDTLTTLTKQYGGSAQSVLAFSKSIAPIASTIGMNQAQVMGMSTAFSRLGEDGFAAGNALNKVMIDLNKASRDGGPELRNYANAMNKSVDELSTQLKDSPASVLVDFTESINKAGPDAIRTLESLGIEGVRTVKAFTALSREGNLGEIIQTAGESYGSGSTSEAAENALSGVNDQMTKLSETTSQMVASAGKPFLGWLEGVLKAANAVNNAFAGLAASGIGQTLAKVGAVAGAGGGAVMTGLQAASMYALARRGGRAIGQGVGQFMGGRAAQAAGAMLPDNRIARAGAMWQTVMPMRGPDDPTARARAGRALRGGGNVLRSAASFGMNVTASDFNTARGLRPFESDSGRLLRSSWSDFKGLSKAGDMGGGLKALSAGLKDVSKTAATTGTGFGKLSQTMKNLTFATAGLGLDAARVGGGAAKGVGKLGLAGLSALGISGPMAAIGGVAAVGYTAYKMRQNQEGTLNAAKAGMEDPYRQFNDFAVKAGYATESIQLLGKASAEAAKTIADKNKNDEDAYKISSEELAAAKAPGYKPAWEGVGGATGNTKEDAVLSFLQNQNATQSQIALQGMDVEAQFTGQGQAFLNERKAMEGMNFGDVITAAVQTSNSQRGFMGKETDDSKATMEATAAYMQQRWSTTGEQFGTEAGQRQKEEDLGVIYEKAVAASNSGQMKDATKYIQTLESATGIKFSEFSTQSALGEASGGMKAGQTWEEALSYLSAKEGTTGATGKELEETHGRQSTPLPEVENKARTASEEATATFNAATGATIDLTKTMFAGNEIAAKNGKTISELDDTMLDNLDATSKAVALAQKNPNQQNVSEAARAVITDMMKQSGGNVATAQGAIRSQLAVAPDDASKAVLAQALGGFSSSIDVARATAGQSQIQGIRTKIQIGQQAAAVPLPENASEPAIQAHEAALAQQAEGIQEMEQTYKSYLINVRNTLIQLGRQEEDMNKSRARSQADFAQQQKYAAQDYGHSRKMATKQFNLSMERAEEDYLKGRMRANRDFNKQMVRGQQQYNLQISRMTRDFHKQQERQAEDNAKAMYDPYTRLEHKRVWDTKQLMSNLRQQNEAIKRQMEQVDKLKESGLSQGTVDLLGLADPANAEQTAKLFGEMMNDPQMIAQMNEQVAGRIDLSKAFTLDVDNVGTRRATEDFATALADAATDYKTSVKQAREDFNQQLKDMATDYTESKKRAREDFNTQMKEMAHQFGVQRARAQEQQKKSLKRMAEDAATARKRTITDLSNAADDMFASLDTLSDDTGKYIAKLPDRHKAALETATGKLLAEYEAALKDGKPKAQAALDSGKPLVLPVEIKPEVTTEKGFWDKVGSAWSRAWKAVSPWGGGNTPPPPPGSGGNEPKYHGSASGITKWSGGKGSAGAGWYQKGNWTWQGGHHNGVDIVGVGTGTKVFTSRSGRIVHSGSGGPEGGWAGNNVIQDVGGGVQLVFAHLSRTYGLKGAVGGGTAVGLTGNTGRSFGAHLHVSARKGGSYVDPRNYLAEGGIVKRPTHAVIGEAGPEMVLPLNDRGAKLLAETMARYLGQHDAKTAKVAPYSTMVVNNSKIHQDYSTNFTGPVQVEASDPAELARQLRQQARSKRLVQPIGAR